MSQLTDVELVLLYRKDKNELVIKKLYDKYMPFLLNYIKSYYLPYLDKEDRLQECYIVLYQAILSFNEQKNVSFFAYYKLLLDRHFYKIIRYQMAEKRQCEKTDYVLAEYEVEQYQGVGYAQTLSPEDILLVREAFEEGCQTLSILERKGLVGKYVYNLPTSNNHAYRGSYKIKRSLKNK